MLGFAEGALLFPSESTKYTHWDGDLNAYPLHVVQVLGSIARASA